MLANDTIGTGPRLQMLSNDEDFNDQIETEFMRWADAVHLPSKLRTMRMARCHESRTEKTICLAVSPSLKSHKIPGRACLFDVIQRVRTVNADRRHKAPRGQFSGKSASAPELQANPALELDYVIAVPRMDRYMEVSAKIYSVYLKYVSPDDIHVYFL